MRTIWKFPIGFGVMTHQIPLGSKVLCCQMQGDKPQLWIEVDPENTRWERSFVLVGTGDVLPPGADIYIGTVQQLGGALIWHAYEVLPVTPVAARQLEGESA